jgi:geranylgeranyl reductase family protein
MDFDVIIVGAGPAGCAAAYDLVAAGRRVLLLDRRRFPRVKPCAGGITVKTARRLRYSIGPVVRQVCTDLQVGDHLDRSTTFRGPHPICAMTVREEFDDYCLRQTIQRGADFRVVTHLSAITETAHSVSAETSGGSFTAKYLIGADGANSVVRRLLPNAAPLALGFAIEAQLPMNDPPDMAFDFGVVEFGYGWLFPKRDHVNVGLYTNATELRPGRAALADYARARLGTDALQHVIGHHIGLQGWHAVPGTARIALVGDAAGLVDPMLGEGIHNAVASGQAAAAAIRSAEQNGTDLHSEYLRELQPLLHDLRVSWQAGHRFYTNVAFGYRALTTRLVRSALMKGYARGLSFSTIRRNFLLLPFQRVRPAQFA